MRKTRVKFQSTGEDAYKRPIHYFASSVAEWRAGPDLIKLLADMQRSGYAFNVFKVSLPATTNYKIEAYTPVVPDDQLEFIGFFEPVTGDK